MSVKTRLSCKVLSIIDYVNHNPLAAQMSTLGHIEFYRMNQIWNSHDETEKKSSLVMVNYREEFFQFERNACVNEWMNKCVRFFTTLSSHSNAPERMNTRNQNTYINITPINKRDTYAHIHLAHPIYSNLYRNYRQ